MNEYNTLCDYLKSIDLLLFDDLYSHPPTCLAVFRELPELGRLVVMRLLFINEAVPKPVIAAWVVKTQQEAFSDITKALIDLHIIRPVEITTARAGLRLNRKFQEHLRIAISGGGKSWTGDVQLEPDKHEKDETFLEQYAKERWESILHFMVGSQSPGEVSVTIKDVLHLAGLVKSDEGESQSSITQAGFQFLLLDRPTQVWKFILHYLDLLQERKHNLVEALQFLFQLSFSVFGKSYPVEGLTETQTVMLKHFREYGLAFRRRHSSQRFYPTRLAVGLATGVNMKASEPLVSEDGFIVVETNYRIYAYTDSSLKTALISLFATILYRFPNVVVANVTRDSVRDALAKGISAEQIINFLRSNAHPEMLKGALILPPTVVDQIRLWELERNRFVFEEGCMYQQFVSQSDFETLRDYAKDNGFLLWENPDKRLMIVNKSGHEPVRKFWKRYRQ